MRDIADDCLSAFVHRDVFHAHRLLARAPVSLERLHLRGWTRAHAIAEREQSFFRIRGAVAEAEQHWRPTRRNDLLLPPGLPLAEAQSLKATYGAELAPEVIAFIDASTNRERSRQRRGYALALVFGLVALAAVIAGTLAWQQRQVAKAEAARAEYNLFVATNTANRLVLELAQTLRHRVGMPIDLVRDILARAQELQDQLIQSGETSSDVRESAARALNELVLTLLEQGDSKVGADITIALTFAGRFHALMTGLVAIQPTNAAWLHLLSLSDNRVGDVLMTAGRFSEALAAYRQAFDLREKLLSIDRNNAEWREALATSYLKIGDALLKLGPNHGLEALQSYEKTISIRDELLDEEPLDRQRKRELAVGYERKGIILSSFGARDEALAVFRKAASLREELVAENQNDAQAQRDLAISYERLGDTFLDLNQIDEARKAFEDSLRIREGVVAANPSNQAQRELAVSFGRMGDVAMRTNSLSNAREWYRKSLVIRETLVTADPSNAIWQADLIILLRKLATVGDDARGRLARALEIAQRLAANNQLGGDHADWVETLERELAEASP